jgi:hypothetical protein
MPQISDAYHSSLYGGDVPDLNFLPSDDRLLDLPYSQETLNSVSEVDFLRSQTPPLIPSSLDRVGPDRRKLLVLYTDMANDDFDEVVAANRLWKEEEDTLGDIKASIRHMAVF